ncbi:sugar phosphate isomerase/epimerase [Candidatus Sumerlaeota bacterium]|nr:sugar phosphate isomerase/epimerase [Candidatus Sumerlaeota bacterium]
MAAVAAEAAQGVLGRPVSAAQKKKPNRVRIGLYSITYLGIWYDGRALTLEEVIGRAKKYGYEGVEIDGKRPHGNPLDWPTARCRELRKRADGEGIDIYSVSANNDFSSPISEHRQSQIAYVCGLIRMAGDLGARTLRVFLGWPGVSKDKDTGYYEYKYARQTWDFLHQFISDEEAWKLCRDALVECAHVAREHNIILALQNHVPIIKDWEDMLRMIKEVNSPHLKACLDAPLMRDKSAESFRRAAREVGSLQALSHYGGEWKPGEKDASQGPKFYRDFIEAMKEIGYTGYIGYELCHPLPIVGGKKVGLDYADKNARLAAEFMRGVVRSVYGESV